MSELNKTVVAADVADEFLTRLNNILAGVGDGIDENEIERIESGGWKISTSTLSIHFDIVAGNDAVMFVIRELDITPTAGLPGNVHRLIADFSDRYLMGIQYDKSEFPETTLLFLKRDIGCVPGENGCLVRQPKH